MNHHIRPSSFLTVAKLCRAKTPLQYHFPAQSLIVDADPTIFGSGGVCSSRVWRHFVDLNQIRGSWLWPDCGSAIWRPPVQTGSRESCRTVASGSPPPPFGDSIPSKGLWNATVMLGNRGFFAQDQDAGAEECVNPAGMMTISSGHGVEDRLDFRLRRRQETPKAVMPVLQRPRQRALHEVWTSANRGRYHASVNRTFP